MNNADSRDLAAQSGQLGARQIAAATIIVLAVLLLLIAVDWGLPL